VCSLGRDNKLEGAASRGCPFPWTLAGKAVVRAEENIVRLNQAREKMEPDYPFVRRQDDENARGNQSST